MSRAYEASALYEQESRLIEDFRGDKEQGYEGMLLGGHSQCRQEEGLKN